MLFHVSRITSQNLEVCDFIDIAKSSFLEVQRTELVKGGAGLKHLHGKKLRIQAS